jgi:uncharacterized protein YegJ (DUF2314 family)
MDFLEFASDDAAMQFAIEEAQRTLPTFFEHYASPRPGQQHFLLKVKFEHDGAIEHIWIADIDPSVSPLEGTIANEPSIGGLQYLDRVTFQPDQITDWMIIENGSMVGGFTSQVAISRMSLAERREHLASLPYRVPGYE